VIFVKIKRAESKWMQNQIELYNQMVTQLMSQQKKAARRLSDMGTQMQELYRSLKLERVSVEVEDQELQI
jgi:hypothetical protein